MVATLPLVFLGTDRWALAILIPALFIGSFGHVSAVVAYTVTWSGLRPRDERRTAMVATPAAPQPEKVS